MPHSFSDTRCAQLLSQRAFVGIARILQRCLRAVPLECGAQARALRRACDDGAQVRQLAAASSSVRRFVS